MKKLGKLQGKHSVCLQFFTGGVFVFSANSSPTIIWFLQIFREPPCTQSSFSIFSVLNCFLPTLLFCKVWGVRRQLFPVFLLCWKESTTEQWPDSTFFFEARWISYPYCRSLTAQTTQNITDTSKASAAFWFVGMQKDDQTPSVSISQLLAAVETSAGQSHFPQQHMCSCITSLTPVFRCPCRRGEAE